MKVLVRLAVILLAANLLVGCGTERAAPIAEGAAVLQQTFRWKMITTWPKNLLAWARAGALRRSRARDVAGRPDSRSMVPVSSSGPSMCSTRCRVRTPRWGTEPLLLGGKAPEAAFFTAVPFGLTAQEMNAGSTMRWPRAWQELYEPFGLVPFRVTRGSDGGVVQHRDQLSCRFPGLRIIPGLGGQVFERAGGVVAAMPGGDMFTCRKPASR